MSSIPQKLISKSRFVEGLTCLKKVWLTEFHAEFKAPLKEADRRRMQVGTEIGTQARALFPTGQVARYVGVSDEEAVAATQQMIQSGATTLFEATFIAGDLVARLDSIVKDGDQWRVFEVKSASSLDKGRHLPDLAFQVFVARLAGLPVSGGSIVHLNKEYRGGTDVAQLFKVVDLDHEVEQEIKLIPAALEQLRRVVSEPQFPFDDPCPNSACKACDFKDHCLPSVPPDHLYYSGLHHMRQKKLIASGIRSVRDLPSNFELKGADALRVQAQLTGIAQVAPTLHSELEKLEFPLYFIDFETIAPELPIYPSTAPYQTIPFQWSCHVVRTLEDLMADRSEHREFIHRASSDPREAFATSLLECVEKEGSILHYSNFEIQVVKALAQFGIASSSALASMIDSRFVDLEVIVKNGYAHPKMQGRSSIKKVLPALDCPLSYKNLEVQDGDMAIVAYLKTLDPAIDASEKAKIYQSLLDYCKLDTYAMVFLLRRLFEVTAN